MSNIQLAENLRRLRDDYGYTQKQIGKKLNISRQAYSNYENGKRIPDYSLLLRIADIYHLPLEALLTQSCRKTGVVNESSRPYYTAMLADTDDILYLSEEEVELILRYRAAKDEDRRIARRMLDLP